MGKQKAPAPPDPVVTAGAQTGQNVATSIANTMLGNVNQIGADGSSLTYKTTGNYDFTDPNTGKRYSIPQQTAIQSLSPQAQAIFDANQAAQGNLANTARDQSAFLQNYLGQPFKGDTAEIERHLFDLGSRTLDPKFAQQRTDVETRLAEQGIRVGSPAYTRAMADLSTGQNNAYTNLALQGRGQAFNELQATRNQPINEITALLSGSQVSQPNYAVNRPSEIPTTDFAGLVNNNYNQRLAAWQQNSANRGGLLGGLFNLGGTLGAAAIMSDRRTKTDIKKVGETDDGQNIYSYRYKHGGPIQIGLMAQEVAKKKPEAVTKINGIMHVDYGKALA